MSLFAMPAGVLTTLATTLLLSLAGVGSAASLDEWRSRSIYQVMTDRFAPSENAPFYMGTCHTELGVYCGGTWRGIKDHLDYIQGMNFDAIWVSPIVAQLPQVTEDGSSYAGYWQQDLYTLNSKFGSLDDLHELMDEVHRRGMFFMMDVVPNHMAYSGHHEDVQYEVLNPFNEKDYYHPYCPMDYSGDNLTALEDCWLGSEYVPLCDLDTESDSVREELNKWIGEMAANHSIDGLRIDAGANVNPTFFPGFMESAGMFGTAEVYLSNETVACEWQEPIGSLINYPLYWKIVYAFKDSKGSIDELSEMIESERQYCPDTTALTTFSENHDVARFANYTDDISRAKNVNAFVILNDGIPIVYQGQEQHFRGGTNPYTNREVLWEAGFDIFAPLYQQIAALNTLRKHVYSVSGDKYGKVYSDVVKHDDHTIVLQKGEKGKQVLMILTNSGEDGDDNDVSFDSGYSSGASLTDILTCNTVSVGNGGSVKVTLKGGEPIVLFSTDALKGSTLCGTDGDRWGKNENITSTQVTTKTTTTVSAGSTITTPVEATMPVVKPTQDYGYDGGSSTASATALAVPSSSIDARLVGSFAAVVVVFTSGFAGVLLGLAG
ncbi:glycoside hydrolase family 13 protein [Hortaea werneckii]|uniref:alpha-amylase n=1 Tax=Hortaea werneckii TaxID=91943 RepID=A0A3M7F0I0_HORWE|nr:glycoside hydrolase family 13 protein [Hortaea werneckii]KAI6880217.1 glycoside hydrolase family 13 protein [Hortaea werneckii]KAI6988464.1 glycoside hydrolase family 13 protein [Hortaea werneckii]KAI7142246.1 glycoside hydrolase family 13 protein [Hortaea werneckii]KAI7169518.1 glycoside hydrolase family 13 protein [Hortaea werneckii]